MDWMTAADIEHIAQARAEHLTLDQQIALVASRAQERAANAPPLSGLAKARYVVARLAVREYLRLHVAPELLADSMQRYGVLNENCDAGWPRRVVWSSR